MSMVSIFFATISYMAFEEIIMIKLIESRNSVMLPFGVPTYCVRVVYRTTVLNCTVL